MKVATCPNLQLVGCLSWQQPEHLALPAEPPSSLAFALLGLTNFAWTSARTLTKSSGPAGHVYKPNVGSSNVPHIIRAALVLISALAVVSLCCIASYIRNDDRWTDWVRVNVLHKSQSYDVRGGLSSYSYVPSLWSELRI